MTYAYIKAVHIIFVVTWFAGLFYIVRLFIYHREAQDYPEPEKDILTKQYGVMEGRLWNIITVPSMVLTVLSGGYLLYAMAAWTQPWMWVKLGFIVGLLAYHFACQVLMNRMQGGVFSYTSHQLRLWNEVATLFLFAIVFIVVLKSAISWIWGLLGLLILSVALMIGVRVYRRVREKSGQRE